MSRTIILVSILILYGCQTIERKNIPVTLLFQGIELLFSGSVPDEITISSTGTGRTREEATQNALKEAVQKGVGVLVISDLTITDQNKVSDKLINYSSGFVKEYKTEDCSGNDKKYTCKITAKISPWNFKKNLVNNSNKEISINSDNLIAQHETFKHVIRQRIKITEYYFSRIFTEGFIGRVESVDVIPSTGENVKIKISEKN